MAANKNNVVRAYAAVQQGEELKRFDYDAGELQQNQVELKVLYCGVCHSDVSMMKNEWGMSSYPLVPGHEAVGRVIRVGSGVKKVKEGDIAGIGWNSSYCLSCNHCMGGDHNLCRDATFTIQTRGGFADKLRADEAAVLQIPEGIDLKCVGPLLCGGITVFNPMVQYDLKPTDSVAVIGIGGLGHMALQFLRAWGCRVTAFTSSESKKAEAIKLGATDTINSRSADEIKAAARRFDLILSTVNVTLDWQLYMSTLKPKGRLHFLGVLTEPMSVSQFPMLVGQLSISSSPGGSPDTIRGMLEFAALHKIAPMVEVFKISDWKKAMEKLHNNSIRYRAVLDCSSVEGDA